MISIGRIGSGPGAADYYLEKQAGCELDYYTGAGEEVGRWLGDGAAALGLTGRLDDVGEQMLRALLSGCGPDGQPLVRPVLRADPRGLLLAEPLVRALDGTGARRSGADLLGEGKAPTAFDAAVADVDAGREVSLPADVVGRVAEAAGLDAVALYRSVDGGDTYAAALPYADAKVDVRRAGFDVTVSAPKSVSFLFALADPAISTAARAAHTTAVKEVVSYLQRHTATAARGHQGPAGRAARIGTDGLIVSAFDHRSSRAGDPQLHTHLVIPNLARAEDGRWSALDSAAFYRHVRTATSLYHAVLRGELTQSLGVGWTPVRRGIAEIDGISRPMIDAFSKRRAQILTATTARGRFGAKAQQVACLITRPAKRHEPPATLRARWRAEAATVGIDAEFLRQLTCVVPTPDEPALDVLAARLLGPSGVTADRTTFTRQHLAQAICDTLLAGTPVRLADIDRLVTALTEHPDVIPVLGDWQERRYTTRELLGTERHAMTLATTPPARPVGVTRMPYLPAVLARTGLSAEQQTMVHALVSSGRRVDVVAGPAGSGKTAALAMTERVWAHAGHQVRGATVSWLAAQNLQAATGIPTASLAKTMRDAEIAGLPPGVVLVLDEASLVNTRTLARLLEHVHAADGKLVLVGDPAQLPEIGAGGLFAALANRDDTIRLAGNQRQHEPWERDALRDLRDGNVIDGLDAYVDHGRVHVGATSEQLRTKIASAYQAALDRGEQVLVLAARRVDVTHLNSAIRDHLIDTGHLGRDELIVPVGDHTRAYRVGERVLVTVNDRDRGLVNGTQATVTAIETRHARVELRTGDGRQLTLDREWLATGQLVHGYATTVHKAQGVTVDTTLVYGLGPLTQEHGYVALSRGRLANHIYIADDYVDVPECGRVDGPEHNDRALTAELRDRMSTSSAHQLASNYFPEPRPRADRDDRMRDLTHHDHNHGYNRDYGLSR